MAEIAYPQPRGGARANPHAQIKGSATDRRAARRGLRRDPLRLHDCPPITDGGVRRGAGRGRPGPRVGRASGVIIRASTTASTRTTSAPVTSPRRRRSRRRPRRPACTTARSTSPSSTPRSPIRRRSSPSPRPRRRRRGQPFGRSARRQPDDGRRPDPDRRGRQPDHVRRRSTVASRTPPRVTCCSRTSSASWRVSHEQFEHSQDGSPSSVSARPSTPRSAATSRCRACSARPSTGRSPMPT